MICVNQEDEIKRYQRLQLKMKFLLGYNLKIIILVQTFGGV